jgi:hypothetical protein
MSKRVAGLSPSAVANARGQVKPCKLHDGGGLFLRVNPDGARWWRLKYRRPSTGKENTLSLGTYPEVSLKAARTRRAEARAMLAEGIRPRRGAASGEGRTRSGGGQ